MYKKEAKTLSYIKENSCTPYFWRRSEEIACIELNRAVVLERYPRVRISKGVSLFYSRQKRLNISKIYSKIHGELPKILLSRALPEGVKGIQVMGPEYIKWATKRSVIKNA